MSLDERLKYAKMKARHKSVLIPWYKKWWGIIILAIIALVLIFLSFSTFYILNKIKEIKSGQTLAPSQNQIQNYLQEINGDGTNYFLGTSTPQLTIIEFCGFSCPHCKKASVVTEKLAKNYKNKIKIVWRDYLLSEDSIDLALAARCAGEQGKFWPMHDLLFANQEDLVINDSARFNKLISLAQNLKLNTTEFSTCLQDKKYLDQIKKDYDDGNALKIEGTPTWFINNYTFSGYVAFDKFDILIQGLLK